MTTLSFDASGVVRRFVVALAVRYRACLLFVATAVVMGCGYVAIRVGTETVPPAFLAAVRFDLSAAILLSYAVTRGRWYPQARADVAAILLLGGLVFAGTIGFLFVGQQYTTASTAAIVMSLGPVLTALVASALVPEECLSRTDALGVGLGLVGAVVLVYPSPGGIDGGMGVVFVLCAVVCSSLGTVLLSLLETTLSTPALTGWGALLGGLVLHLVSVGLAEPVGTVRWQPGAVVAVLYLAVVVSVGGYVAYLLLLAEVGPARSSLTSYASPVVATVVGWSILGEVVTAVTLLGFFVTTAGFVATNWSLIDGRSR
ncbi:DMT family transporter [Natribaculum luteum]|uniref:DMT family transporter n=1 Tax=Natribaculum luteum TaxID=1586232 RepID=A0ABD5NVF8_9EURY|nr:DMT family transporter [Natribaculum luteum]